MSIIQDKAEKVKIDASKQVRPWNQYLVNRAFEIAARGHYGQKRDTGEDYVSHPIAVANIVASLKCDLNTFIAALLHDVVEDTAISLQQLNDEFGKEVAFIVDSLTKLSKLERQQKQLSDESNKAETLRKILVGSAKDLRVAYIKLADRLHNISTSSSISKEKIEKNIQQTTTYFAPLARELGIRELHRNLDLWSLKLAQPSVFDELKLVVSEYEKELNQKARRVMGKIGTGFRESGISGDMIEKTNEELILSIYSLINERNLSTRPKIRDAFVQNYELTWVFNTIADCYKALGVIHTHWPPVYSYFRDWIFAPSSNGYSAIHTLVQVALNEFVTFRLQTRELRRVAEWGPLFLLREAYNYDDMYKTLPQSNLLDRIVEIDDECDSTEQFLEYIRLDILPPKIRIFVLDSMHLHIPKRTSILDLAYTHFTRYAHECSSAIVNGLPVSVAHILHDGDLVKLQFSSSTKPDPEWLFGITYFTATTKYSLAPTYPEIDSA